MAHMGMPLSIVYDKQTLISLNLNILRLLVELHSFGTAMSGNDFSTSGTGSGNGKFHSHFSGTGIQVENSNPTGMNIP